jgi:hypothetical protein
LIQTEIIAGRAWPTLLAPPNKGDVFISALVIPVSEGWFPSESFVSGGTAIKVRAGKAALTGPSAHRLFIAAASHQ